VITLNTDTELAVEFDGAVRRIRLERGQVFFSVTPDPQRPFEVFAHDGIVRAVGTSFDVALDDANQVTVTVLEGTVEVMPGASQNPASTAASPPKVTHGEKVKYWQNGAIAQVTSADATAVRAWREGKLDFDNQRLDDAIAEHNRYTSTKIIVGDDELKGLRISGVFRIGDTESLLFLLKESLGVTTVKKANVIVLLPNRKLREAEQPVAPGEAARG
jgi:transmembrane sensor